MLQPLFAALAMAAASPVKISGVAAKWLFPMAEASPTAEEKRALYASSEFFPESCITRAPINKATKSVIIIFEISKS